MFHIGGVMNKIELISKISQRNELEKQLKGLIYGSVEIRERDKKYIYVHYREDGIAMTKYVGEYSDELYNLILNNSVRARAIKKEISKINKELKASGHVEGELSVKVQLNIDFARRNLVDTIYHQAILEGVATTYANTETIIEGGKVSNMTASDLLKVVNLKHAWDLVLNKDVILSPTNFALLSDINRLVEEGFYYNAGRVRSTPVSIGGTNWKPEIPIESKVREDLDGILNSKQNDMQKAIDLLLYVMKKQIFIDGNKRTAVIFANHYLISHAKGLIVIPEQRVEEYKNLLIDFYEGKGENKIKTFIKKHAYKQM